MNNIAVIPTLNPSKKIWTVVEELQSNHFDTIVIVNDGSRPTTQYIFDKLEREYHCHVLVHPQNMGKGAALKTAMSYVQEHFDCLGIVTLDDDGQHLTKDVVACSEALNDHPDCLILGVRDFTRSDIPQKSKIGNRVTSIVMGITSGLHLQDTQTGLRCIPSAHFDIFLQSKGDRFEDETNMLLDSGTYKIQIIQVPIETVYIDQNSETHFHPIKDSLKIYRQFLSYFASSMSAFLIDMGLFILFTNLLPIENSGQLVFISACAARLFSSIFNFICNKKLVYRSSGNTLSSLVKYYILCVLQTGLSAFFTATINALLPGVLYLVKICVDLTLFFFSYHIQKNIVFQSNPTFIKKINKIIRRFFAVLFSIVLLALFAVVGLVTVVFTGPSEHAATLLVNSCMESSALKFVPHLYFTEEEVTAMTNPDNAQLTEYLASRTETKVEVTIPTEADIETDEEPLTFEDVDGVTYHGKMVIVKDPSRLKLYTLDSFTPEVGGTTVKEVSLRDDVEIAFNAGGFADPNGRGNGGTPRGVVISDGELKFDQPSQYNTFIGIDEENKLIVDDISGPTALARTTKPETPKIIFKFIFVS